MIPLTSHMHKEREYVPPTVQVSTMYVYKEGPKQKWNFLLMGGPLAQDAPAR